MFVVHRLNKITNDGGCRPTRNQLPSWLINYATESSDDVFEPLKSSDYQKLLGNDNIKASRPFVRDTSFLEFCSHLIGIYNAKLAGPTVKSALNRNDI